jgi:aldose 1-epimerase
MPGLQFYAAGLARGAPRKAGAAYRKNSGLALEPQHLPDSPNRPDFPSPLLRAGEEYRHVIALDFGVM